MYCLYNVRGRYMSSKKKIAIFTIHSINYGNRLQNYVVQKIITKLGYKPYTLRWYCNKSNLLIYRLIKYVFNMFRAYGKGSNLRSFLDFDRKMCFSNDYINKESFRVGDYYAILVGSDQIWNTTFDFVSVNSFLPFIHPKKIAFSASFGVDSIPYDKQIVDCLNDFKALSVREEAGAKIIKELTGRDATILVDPTMLFTNEEWRKVSKKPKGAKGGYILTYFLSPKCDEAKAKLEEIRGDRDVYELSNPDDKVAGTAGPSEFLWLFDHADMVLTDSFHACVFSFLFNKPFIVYDRNWQEGNMNSRLETLLSKFHIERKYANSGLDNDIWEHDYSEGYQQLDIEREKAIDFLKKALED